MGRLLCRTVAVYTKGSWLRKYYGALDSDLRDYVDPST